MRVLLSARRRRLTARASAAVLLVAAVATGTTSLQAQPGAPYDAFEYARIPDFTSSAVVRGINTLREVAGGFRQADVRRTTTALIATGTGIIDITADLITDYSTAYGINDRGEVAGGFNGPVSLLPFRSVRRAAFQELPLLAGDTGGLAYGINDLGEAVGYSSGTDGERAVWWTRAGEIRQLPSIQGLSSRALGVNHRGDVVGSAGEEPRRAVLWPAKGNPVGLGTLAGFAESEAVNINARGEIVGFAMGVENAPDRTHAVLWGPGGQSIRDLGTLAGGTDSRARDINARGEVVGTSTSTRGGRAFVWTAANGMVDLNALVSLPGFVLTDALGINQNGDIVAVAQEAHHDATGGGGHEHTDHEVPRRIFVLTPRPVPTPGR